MENARVDILDVAIVGGGSAGAYAAYRLRDHGNVALFERSERIGGRLWTHFFPEGEDTPADLGGMAFTKVQQNVFGLVVKELQLEYSDFPPYSMANVQHLRQSRFHYEEYSDPARVPFQLPAILSGSNPGSILRTLFCQWIPGLEPRVDEIVAWLQAHKLSEATAAMTELNPFLRTACVGGKPGRELWRFGAWDFLLLVATPETYQLIEQSAFYVSLYRAHNLYDAVLGYLNVYFSFFYPVGCSPVLCGPERPMATNIFGDLENSPPAYAPVRGFDHLPRELVARFQAAGGQVVYRHELTAIHVEEDSEGIVCVLHFHDPLHRGPRTVRARRVILSLLKHPLEKLCADSILFRSSTFRQDLEALNTVALSKVFLTFDEPWWRTKGPAADRVLRGYSSSDLPINTPYYFTGEGVRPAIILASLTSEERIPFWEAFRGGARPGLDLDLRVTQGLLEAARSQLETLHGYPVPQPTGGVFVDWGQEPYGAGRHNWCPGRRSWEVIPRLRRPLEDVPIYLCGEAFSAWHGWVEGALNTAERVLEEHFGLPRPDWILPEYDLGP